MGSRVSVLKEEDAARLKSQLQDLGILICFTERKPRIEEPKHLEIFRLLMIAWDILAPFFSHQRFQEACTTAAQCIWEAEVMVFCASVDLLHVPSYAMKYWNASNLDFIPDIQVNGAGFSADSGLAVYADVAKAHPTPHESLNLVCWRNLPGMFVNLEVPAYRDRKLTYQDVCQPHWLFEEPDLFWGFWGQCTELRNWELDRQATLSHAVISFWTSDEAFKKSLPDFNFF